VETFTSLGTAGDFPSLGQFGGSGVGGIGQKVGGWSAGVLECDGTKCPLEAIA